MKTSASIVSIFILVLFFAVSCKKDPAPEIGVIELKGASVGDVQLVNGAITSDVPINQPVILNFSEAVDSTLVNKSIFLKDNTNTNMPYIYFEFADAYKQVILKHNANLQKLQQYSLEVTSSLKGSKGETFTGAQFQFTTVDPTLSLKRITIDGQNFMTPYQVSYVAVTGAVFEVEFSHPVDTVQVKSKFTIDGSAKFNITFNADLKSATMIWPDKLADLTKYNYAISSSLKARERIFVCRIQ